MGILHSRRRPGCPVGCSLGQAVNQSGGSTGVGGRYAIDELRVAFLLVVDQFEELFTLCTDEQVRRDFLERLLSLTQAQRVIITMRADFWGDCAPYTELKDAMQAHQELIAPMTLG